MTEIRDPNRKVKIVSLLKENVREYFNMLMLGKGFLAIKQKWIKAIFIKIKHFHTKRNGRNKSVNPK